MLLGKVKADNKKSFADLLNWAALIDEGMVLCKDGSLVAGWHYTPPDGASMTDDERNYLSNRLNQAFMTMDRGWTTWVEAVRMPSNQYPTKRESYFPDPISEAIDGERRQQFEQEGSHFETYYAILVMFQPERKAKSMISDLMFNDEKKSVGGYADRIIGRFKRDLEDIEGKLGSVMRVQRMGSVTVLGVDGREHYRDELLTFLHVCVNGTDTPLNVPPVPMYLDSVLGGQDFMAGVTPRYGEKYVSVIGFQGFPPESYPGILDVLNSLAITYRWSTRYVHMEYAQASREYKRQIGQWGQKGKGVLSDIMGRESKSPDRDALSMAEQAREGLAMLNSGTIKYGFFTANVILMHEDRDFLEELSRYVLEIINGIGFVGRVESLNTVEAWIGSLPGHSRANIRRPMMGTDNLSHLIPTSTEWPGAAQNMNPLYPPGSPPLFYGRTPGTTPFRFNLHGQDDLGHLLGFGPTGSGKSVLIALIAASFLRYRNATVIAFDKGRSIRFLCEAAGGNFYDLGVGVESPGFAPLSHLDDPDDLAWTAEWIATCYQLEANTPVTPEQKGAINRALFQMAREKKEDRTLSEFITTVSDKYLREVMTLYSVESPLGYLLDSKEDQVTESHFMCFEMDEFLTLGDKVIIPTLLYLFRRIEKRLKGQPALILMDEAWVLFRNPMIREKIMEWLRTFRRANCAVVMFTQTLEDVYKSGIMNVLLESCPNRVLLPNESATRIGSAGQLGPGDYYRLMGLNEREVVVVSEMIRKKQYYFTSPGGKRLFELELGPIALSFLAVSSREDLGLLKSFKQEHGRQWPLAWLNARGVKHDIKL